MPATESDLPEPRVFEDVPEFFMHKCRAVFAMANGPKPWISYALAATSGGRFVLLRSVIPTTEWGEITPEKGWIDNAFEAHRDCFLAATEWCRARLSALTEMNPSLVPA